MRESLFWEAMELSRTAGRRGQPASLHRILIEIPDQEIISFAQTQRRRMHQLYTSGVSAAHFIICSYTSDDSFEDFTAWIVAQGKRVFDHVRKMPSTLTRILDKREVAGVEWDAFTLLAGRAYEEKTGKEDFVERVGLLNPPKIRQKWPETRGEFEARYPELYKKFWNQRRIAQIHS